MSRRDQEWFDSVFGYAASAVADIRDRVLFEGWSGHKPGVARAPNVENIYRVNFYGDAAPPRITSVGEIEPFDPILRENMYPEKTAAKVYFDAFSPQPQSDRERQSDDPARAIGVDR